LGQIQKVLPKKEYSWQHIREPHRMLHSIDKLVKKALAATSGVLWSKHGVLRERQGFRQPDGPIYETIEVRESMDGNYLELPNFDPSADFWDGRKIRLVMLAEKITDEG